MKSFNYYRIYIERDVKSGESVLEAHNLARTENALEKFNTPFGIYIQ
jgi:hypothetical protein